MGSFEETKQGLLRELNKTSVLNLLKRKFKKQVGVLFSDDIFDLLIEITDRKELPVSEFIRDIVEEKLYQLSKEGDLNE